MNKLIDTLSANHPVLTGLGLITLFIGFGFIEKHYAKHGIIICWLWAGGMAIALLVKLLC
jgi:hypothetical protein